jgi:Multicopper oxidase
MTASADRLPEQLAHQYSLQEMHFSRRKLLLGAGAAGLVAFANRPSQAQAAPPAADHTIRIAPISLEIGPNKIIQTTGYNGKVAGPPLRLKEGKPVAINVINDSGYPNLIHWHGLFVPSLAAGDGCPAPERERSYDRKIPQGQAGNHAGMIGIGAAFAESNMPPSDVGRASAAHRAPSARPAT